MTLVNVGSMFWPPIPPHWGNAGPSLSGIVSIDAAGEKYAAVFRAPRTGTLSRIRFRTGTVVTGDTVRVSFQNVDLATGNPDEVIDQYRDIVIDAANDNVPLYPGIISSDGTDTGTKRSVTRGDYLALVFEFPSFVAGNISIAGQSGSSGTKVFPYLLQKAAGSWTKIGTAAPCFALEYDDGSYYWIPDVVPSVSGIGGEAFASTTNPDERGNRLELPMACTSSGVWWFGYTGGTGDVDLKLYDGSGALLRTQRVDQDVFTASVAHSPTKLLWNEGPIDLAVGTYRIAHQAANTANATIYQWSFPVVGVLDAMEIGQLAYSTTRNDLGAWTDLTTKLFGIGLILSQVHAAGGGRRPRLGRVA